MLTSLTKHLPVRLHDASLQILHKAIHIRSWFGPDISASPIKRDEFSRRARGMAIAVQVAPWQRWRSQVQPSRVASNEAVLVSPCLPLPRCALYSLLDAPRSGTLGRSREGVAAAPATVAGAGAGGDVHGRAAPTDAGRRQVGAGRCAKHVLQGPGYPGGCGRRRRERQAGRFGGAGGGNGRHRLRGRRPRCDRHGQAHRHPSAGSAAAHEDGQQREGDPPLDAAEAANPETHTFPNGCHLAEVEVDRETGAIEAVRYVVCDDMGRMIAPMIVCGQM